MHRRHRLGMTLIELLVVIAIIAVLAGLLLPAIIQARGAGRKTQCASNLKQLAQAVQSFHQRMDCLPAYWGANKAVGAGERFGGWLYHLLPDMDQLVLYEAVQPNITSTGSYQVVASSTTEVVVPNEWVPAVPQSNPYSPGTWQYVKVGQALVNGAITDVYEWQLVGRVGNPGRPGHNRTRTIYTYRYVSFTSGTGLLPEYATQMAKCTLPFLTDTEDVGITHLPSTITSGSLGNQQLTNYQANAHVFVKFRPRTNGTLTASGTITPDAAGLFTGPFYRPTGSTTVSGTWQHSLSGSSGIMGRTFAHVTDGLTNTILFAEGRRQCDGLRTYRAAFFPSANPTNEHGFGIECQFRDINDPTKLALGPTGLPLPTFGNTLMFQTMPTVEETNPLRVQALHGEFLMTAMCDGSVRAISSLVAAREPKAANASGRENFGSIYYTASSRGGASSDGVWDMLMVPNDPAGNVLENTGEIGREGEQRD